MSKKRKRKTLLINKLTSEIYNSGKIKQGIEETKVLETWKDITNDKIILRTKKLYIKEKLLLIKLSSSALRNELENNKKTILSKIKERHSSINKILFI